MKRRCFGLLCALFLCLSACAPHQNDPPAPAAEDRLVVYTSHKEEVYGPIVKEFQERTGIWVEVVTGGTNELLERIAAQAEAPECDVMFGGGVESLSAYADLFAPYTCSGAELLKPGLRGEGDLWTPFSALPVVLIYNTKLVDEAELTGWEDLLDSRWKGRIAFADPAVSGSSYTAAVTMLSCLPGETWELVRAFAENLEGALGDSGDVVSAVSGGRKSIGVTLEETALKGIAQGENIGVVYPAEGTSAVPDGSALILGAPHPDNAKAFLEFVQSADVQSLVVSAFSRRSVRQDVADREELPTEEEMGVFDYPMVWASALKEEFLIHWADFTGEETP
ncbi:ABC transporter substrate-binding protein [Vermiculatibacterium agrestimuris]|uniref:ABC transporter substrate-binding protein n=1 Tax=Vermiculatibacterium agrestimuris TaxID=2941519 RepID=UPI00203D28BB|nr:ABC transporter substrate-binding protein [Vermiculatibacterium agrestimuris]